MYVRYFIVAEFRLFFHVYNGLFSVCVYVCVCSDALVPLVYNGAMFVFYGGDCGTIQILDADDDCTFFVFVPAFFPLHFVGGIVWPGSRT